MDNPRRPHAALNLDGRWPKAQKIERILACGPRSDGRPLRLLEIGTGSGAIAHYFATRAQGAFDVEAVDVLDQRQVSEGYRFTRVEDVALPFPSGTFDVVISNHVIEHVGDEDRQREHLGEMRRVLAAGGTAYLATPNRWQLVEPHFHLPFLSWLPPRWRSGYVRRAGRGAAYDCRPLRMGELERLLSQAGLVHRNAGVQALREVLAIEHRGRWLGIVFGWIPDGVLHALRRINPTHVYVLGHGQDAAGGIEP